jgi:sugar-specific transcriptional regulator TrmB
MRKVTRNDVEYQRTRLALGRPVDPEEVVDMAERALDKAEEWEEEFNLADQKEGAARNDADRYEGALDLALDVMREAVRKLTAGGRLDRKELARELSEAIERACEAVAV